MKKLVLAIMASLLLSACTTRIATMTVISDRNIKTQHVKVSKLPKTKDVVGESKRVIFLFFPLGLPSIKEALDDALSKADGDLMIDAGLYTRSWWFIFGETGYELRGTVVNTREGSKQ